jgi:hypothetical protein
MTSIPITVVVKDSAGASASIVATANVTSTDAPQYPALLNAYILKPSWSVTGVNSYAGYPTTTVLKNPSTISMAGISISGKTLTINGNNVTLNGYDFSGWQLTIAGTATNILIQNNKIVSTASGQDCISVSNSGSVIISNNLLDGGAALSGASGAYGIQQHIIWVDGNTPSLTISGNYFTNMFNDGIDLTANHLGIINITGNLFDKWGTGTTHGDCIQTFSVDSTNQNISALNVLNNTCYLPTTWTVATEDNSFIRTGNNGSGKLNNTHVAFNVCVFPAGARPCASILQIANDAPGPGLINTWVHDNYFDDSAIEYADVDPNIAGYNYGAVTNSCAYNLYRMNANAALLLGQYSNHPSGGGPAAAPAVPVITSGSVSAVRGTGPKSTQISIFLDGILTAAVKSDANGNWTYTPPGAGHAVVVRAVDAFANASAASNSVGI